MGRCVYRSSLVGAVFATYIFVADSAAEWNGLWTQENTWRPTLDIISLIWACLFFAVAGSAISLASLICWFCLSKAHWSLAFLAAACLLPGVVVFVDQETNPAFLHGYNEETCSRCGSDRRIYRGIYHGWFKYADEVHEIVVKKDAGMSNCEHRWEPGSSVSF